MYAVMLVLDDPNRLDEVLDAWEKVGIRGVTIIESTGWQRRRLQRGLLGMRFASISAATLSDTNLTLFVVVNDHPTVQKCLEATEAVVGDLDGPNTGILTAWPIEVVKGLPSNDQEENT
jgi:nitrogen regulatory protein PII